MNWQESIELKSYLKLDIISKSILVDKMPYISKLDLSFNSNSHINKDIFLTSTIDLEA